MVTFLITSALLLGFFGFFALAIYFWQKPAKDTQPLELPPPPTRGLFEDDYAQNQIAEATVERDALRSGLLERAARGDTSALQDAHESADSETYNDVLNSLVELLGQPRDDAQLLSLVSRVTRENLPVNTKLADAVTNWCSQSPDRNSTAKMLHIAALSDDPATYQRAVESALNAWRSGKLSDASPTELQAILDGEFWILSAHARGSGAGFVLKRTLASARRELQEAHDG
jgi:hypothetical protein